MSSPRLLPLILVGAFTLAACSSPALVQTTSEPQQERPAAGAVQSTGAYAVNLDVDFEIEVYTAEDVVGGQDIHFSDIFNSGKPVVLNYWAGLCPPCRAEMPDFQKVNDAYQDKVTIFGLDIGPFIGLGSIEEGKALLKRLGITYPTGTTLDPRFLQKHPPLGMPTTFFMAPDGTIVEKWTGLLTKDKLAELIADLLEASTSEVS